MRLRSNRNTTRASELEHTLLKMCPSMRNYVEGYGVTINIEVEQPQGGNAMTVKLDSVSCGYGARPSLALGAAGTTGRPTGECNAYVGRLVRPISIDAAISRFQGIAPKSEFETTAQFEARKAAAVGGPVGSLVIEKTPEGQQYFSYDADAQVLNISPFGFDNTNFPTWEAFYKLGLDSRYKVSTGSNIDVVISDREAVTGTYKASNAFGAQANVAKVTRTVKAIFDRAPKQYSEPLFPTPDGQPYSTKPIGQISLSPDEARALKPSLRIAFVVAPNDPYLLKGSTPWGKTTVQNPQDITIDFTILMADIQCGLLMDTTGKVVGAYKTN